MNQGTINVFSPNTTSLINVVNITNTATLSAQHGTLELEGANLILQPSGTLSVGLNSATDYGTIYINSNSLNLSVIGSLLATLNGGFVPAINNSFQVLTYPSTTAGGVHRHQLPA